ncbi:MAG: DUF4234 domain-containing protein [Spirochaetes bacterium]|nr:DUF4234 domain-containing protein [Spirochaetota bacterium]
MKKRSPFAVFFLPIITLGIYGIVWLVKTKEEMKSKGADIPTAWLLIVPIANIVWYVKYAKGVEKVTNGKTTTVAAFLLLLCLSTIGAAIIQSKFNEVG